MSKVRRAIPNILIGLGALLVLIFVVYMVFTYPWKMLFAKWGWIDLNNDLPDPKPISDELLNYDGDDLTDVPMDTLPSDGSWFGSRPAMRLDAMGIIKIPRLQVSENIIEGSGHEMLYGVGHVRGTAMPGQEGNCVLAAHRNYIWMRPFRYLDRVELGDYVYIKTDEYTYTYEAFQIFEITVADLWILEDQEEVESHLLTLLTCTPPMAVDPPTRLIVWCKLIDTQINEDHVATERAAA